MIGERSSEKDKDMAMNVVPLPKETRKKKNRKKKKRAKEEKEEKEKKGKKKKNQEMKRKKLPNFPVVIVSTVGENELKRPSQTQGHF